VISTHEIGRGNDGVVYDAAPHKVYTPTAWTRTLVIYDQLDADTYRLSEPDPSLRAHHGALDSKTKKVYLVTAEGTPSGEEDQPRGRALLSEPVLPGHVHRPHLCSPRVNAMVRSRLCAPSRCAR